MVQFPSLESSDDLNRPWNDLEIILRWPSIIWGKFSVKRTDLFWTWWSNMRLEGQLKVNSWSFWGQLKLTISMNQSDRVDRLNLSKSYTCIAWHHVRSFEVNRDDGWWFQNEFIPLMKYHFHFRLIYITKTKGQL